MENTDDKQQRSKASVAETLKCKFLAVLVELPEEDRNAAYVQASLWEWPKALVQYKEDRFEEMSNREKLAATTWKAMWDAIHQCTSAFGRSQAWWVIELGRTREEHAEWIANGCRLVSTVH